MTEFTVLLKRGSNVDVFVFSFYREARQCLLDATKNDKRVKVYIYSKNSQSWHRYKPRKPYDGGTATYLRRVSKEFLPPEAAFIQI